jgi:Cd2+/Zn2+-exporting ATPase
LDGWISQRRTLLQAVSSGLTLAGGWLLIWLGGVDPLWSVVLFIMTYALAGLPTAVRALAALVRRGQFDTDLLMIAAAAGAALLGQWAEGATLLFLFNLGHVLEHRALDRARKAIRDLADLHPKTARVRREGQERAIGTDQIRLHDTVLISPGERVPIDGLVREGSSAVDQSPITGESLPVAVGPGDQILAGSLNGAAALEVEATRLAKDSTLSRAIELIQHASEKKSPTEKWSDRMARVLVPTVLAVGALLIVIPPLFGLPFRDSFLRAMTLLVAASPCALALGPPAAILAGLARAARAGVLIKGGANLERLGTLRALAFDKTGTLTRGAYKVTEIVPAPGWETEQVLAIAAAVESRSAHPLAAAVVTAAEERELQPPPAEAVTAQSGLGVRGTLEQGQVQLGAASNLLPEDGEGHAQLWKAVRRREAHGDTVIVVRLEGSVIGLIALGDELRAGAQETLTALRQLGIEQTLMLSGDSERAAGAIAAKLDLDRYWAEMLPEDKVETIQRLRGSHGPIGMVGDGVNDAPALAGSNVGIAMGGAKTEAALETADVVLMGDDLTRLPFVIDLGRRTRRIIQQNSALALVVILALSALALTNLASITAAVVIHEGSTLLVLLNALRLLGPSSPGRAPVSGDPGPP